MFAITKKILILSLLLTADSCRSLYATLNGTTGTALYLSTNYTFSEGESATGYVRFTNGFTLPGGGTIHLGVHEPISGLIHLKNGMINLTSDLYLGAGTQIVSGGTIELNGHTIFLDDDITLTNGVFFGISGGKVEGRGHRICATSTGELSSFSVLETVTYSNIRFEGLSGFSSLLPSSGSATLYNVTIAVDDNAINLNLFTPKIDLFGNIEFISPNPNIRIGFLVSGNQMYIHSSTRMLVGDSTFLVYGARNTFFEDKTSSMHLKNCFFMVSAAIPEGQPIRNFTKGTITVDGLVKVITNNISGLKFGDGTLSNEPTIIILPSSTLDFSRFSDFVATTSSEIIYAGVH